MALGEGLGRYFDVEPQISRNTSANAVNLKDAAGVTFVCFVPNNGGDTFIVKQSAAHASGFVAFNPITRYYNKSALDGSAQWTDSGDLTANLGTMTIGSGCVAFYVSAADIPSQNPYVEVLPGTSGIVVAIVHDLLVQRNPKYLRALNA